LIIFAMVSLRFENPVPGFAAGIPLGVLVHFGALSTGKPKNREEKAEGEACKVVRNLKGKASENRLQKFLPPKVLEALERAATVHAGIATRLSTNDPHGHDLARESLDAAMDACLRAVAPVIRHDDTPKAEWEALLANKAMIGSIVDAIDTQILRMQDEIDPSEERSQALRELNSPMPINQPETELKNRLER
jgi:hypothetical protein